jgi:hypothetical protein
MGGVRLSNKIEKMVKLMREKWVLEFQLQFATDIPWTPFQKQLNE